MKDSCLLSQLTYFFDNNATIFFAVFMSFWATMFLELWKRKQSILQDCAAIYYEIELYTKLLRA